MDAPTGKKEPVAAFKTGRAALWTRERLEQLSRQELLQLQANAVQLLEPELAALCAEVLKQTPARGASSAGAASRPALRTRLIPRMKAFEARGIWLQNARMSWSGVRTTDGTVVFALWAQSIESRDGGCCYLLWAPNAQGQRPWSDTIGGRERLEHCRKAIESGSAEGFLVRGERLHDRLPEDRAKSVFGVDPETTIAFRVEQRGAEYWAVWGRATSSPALPQG